MTRTDEVRVWLNLIWCIMLRVGTSVTMAIAGCCVVAYLTEKVGSGVEVTVIKCLIAIVVIYWIFRVTLRIEGAEIQRGKKEKLCQDALFRCEARMCGDELDDGSYLFDSRKRVIKRRSWAG